MTIEINDIRLKEIIEKVKNGSDFYSLLTSEEDEQLNDRAFENALYMLTDDDKIKDSGVYHGVDFPPHLNKEKNKELKDIFYFCRLDMRVLATYWNLRIDKGFMVDEIVSDGEWTLEGADVLVTLFDIEYQDAEELAEELDIDSFYFSDTIQIQYYYDYEEAKLHLLNDEEAYNNRESILKMIESLDNYDIKEFDSFKESVLDDE